MKYIKIFLVLILILWYAGSFNSSLIIDDNKTYYCASDIQELYQKGIIKKPNFNNRYYSQQKSQYFMKRTYIPFIYKRDTIASSELGYFSESTK